MKRLTILGIIACLVLLLAPATVFGPGPHDGLDVTVVNTPLPVTGEVEVNNTADNPVPVVIQQTTSSVEEFVIIRQEYTVPNGKRLLIDDLTVKCHLIMPAYNHPDVDLQITASSSPILRIVYPDDKCPEELVGPPGQKSCPRQDHSLGPASGYSVTGITDGRQTVRVLAGRRTAIIADEGATLYGLCPGLGADLDIAYISVGIGRLIDLP